MLISHPWTIFFSLTEIKIELEQSVIENFGNNWTYVKLQMVFINTITDNYLKLKNIICFLKRALSLCSKFPKTY